MCPQTVLYLIVSLSLLLGSNTMFVQKKGLEDGPNSAEIADNLSAAIVDIVERSFIRNRKILTYNLYAFVQRPERRYLFGDIMENVLRSSGESNTVRIGMGEPVPGDHERHYDVLLVDSAASLKFVRAELIKFWVQLSNVLSFFFCTYVVPSIRSSPSIISTRMATSLSFYTPTIRRITMMCYSKYSSSIGFWV